jgi:hypothetical protein
MFPTLALTVCAVLYLIHLYVVVSPRLAPVVAQLIAQSLHRQVRISRFIGLSELGTAEVTGVTVSNSSTFATDHGLPAITIKDITIRYDVAALLTHPAQAAEALEWVRVDSPTVYVERYSSGRLNFSDLFKPNPKSQPLPLRCMAVVRNGTVIVKDELAPSAKYRRKFAIENLDGTVDCTSPTAIFYSFTASGPAPIIQALSVQGESVRNHSDFAERNAVVNPGYGLRVRFTDAALPFVATYLGVQKRAKIAISAGTATGEIDVKRFSGPNSTLTLEGRLSVAGATVGVLDRKFVTLPFRNVDVHSTFTSDSVAFVGDGEFHAQKVRAAGDVINFRDPSVYASVDSDGLDFARVAEGIPALPQLPKHIEINSPVSVHSWISGKVRDMSVDATVDVPNIDCYGLTLDDAIADVTYHGGQIAVHSLTARSPLGTGTLSAKATIDLRRRTPVVAYSGAAQSVNLAEIPLTRGEKASFGPLKGTATATFSGDGRQLYARLAVGAGEVKRIPFDAVEGEASWNFGEAVVLKKFFIRQPGSGLIVASGTVPTDPNSRQLNVVVQGAQIDGARIASAFTSVPVRGLFYLRGAVTGTLNSPQTKAHLIGLQPGYGQYGADFLQADVTGDVRLLKINKLQIRHLPGILTATGSVENLTSARPSINLAVTLDNSPISYLATGQEYVQSSRASKLPVSGFVDGAATVTGTFADPDVTAHLSLSDGIYQGFQLSDVSANIRYADKMIELKQFGLTIAGVSAAGSGTYNLSSTNVSLFVNADAPDIQQVARKLAPTVHVSGGLEMRAHVFGPFARLGASATVSSDGITLEGVKFVVNPVTIDYGDDSVELASPPLTFTSGGSSYTLASLRLDLTNKTIDASGDIANESITHLISVVQTSPYLAKVAGPTLSRFLARNTVAPYGNLEVPSILVRGPWAHPQVSVDADLTKALIAGQKIDELHAKFNMQQQKINIDAFQLTGPDNAYLELTGKVDLSGSVDATLEASGFDLSILNPFLPVRSDISGTIEDLTVVATGATVAPDLEASISVDDPGYGTFSINRIDSGEVLVQNHRLTINGLNFTKEEDSGKGSTIDHTVLVTGSIPFEWKSGETLTPVIPQDQPIDLQATLPIQPLSFVNKLLPSLPVRFSAGTVAANLTVTGSLDNKNVNGSFTLDGAAFTPVGYETAFQNVDIGLRLAGQSFQLQKFTGTSSFGGTITGTGGGQFTGAGLTDMQSIANTALGDISLALSFKTANLVVNERKIALFEDAGATARINGQLTVTGKLLRPSIAGQFNLDKVVGSLPQTSAVAGVDTGPPTFDPSFNVSVKVGAGSQIKTSQLNAITDGTVNLTGSLYRPNLDATFYVRKGQFYFPTATFRVVPVGSVNLNLHSPTAMAETIDMTATTSISVSQGLLERNPAGVNTATAYVPSLSTSAGTGSNQLYTVTVTITGRLDIPDRLNLSFTSNPPGLTNEQILAALGGSDAIAGLTGGNVLGAVQDQVASVFNASVVPKLLQPFENSVGSVFGLEDFSINYIPESPVQVTIVKRLGSKLSVTYTQSVESRSPGAVSTTLEPPEYQVQLGYSFTPKLEATVSTDDQNNTIFAIEGVYKF